jgi:hypothetical protein
MKGVYMGTNFILDIEVVKISFLITWSNVVCHHRNLFTPRFYIHNYPCNEGKVTLVFVHAMVAYRGSRGIAVLIFYPSH